MPVELSSYGPTDYDEQARSMSPEQIMDQLGRDNVELAQLGVRSPISVIVFGARRYGNNYEFRLNGEGSLRPTPMNCFMALLRNQPDLRRLPQGDFEKLGKLISRVAIATETLFEKQSGIDWPDQFTQSPQRLLTPEPTA